MYGQAPPHAVHSVAVYAQRALGADEAHALDERIDSGDLCWRRGSV
jgi:hypothetical protein